MQPKESPQINNIKLSFSLGSSKQLEIIKQLKSHENTTKVCSNFFVLRDVFVYIIFHSGHVNITKIKKNKYIKLSIKYFLKKYKIPYIVFPPYRIDNYSSHGKFNITFLKLSKVLKYNGHDDDTFVESNSIKSVHLNLNRFPSLFIKTIFGSILLFGNGKYIFVGSKSGLDIYYQYQILRQIIVHNV